MKKNIKRILGYLTAVLLTVVFALLIDGKIGWFFLTVLICAAFLSWFAAFFTSKSISVEADSDNTMLYKGERLRLKASVKCRFPFPAALISVRLAESGRLVSCSGTGGAVFMPSPKMTEEGAENSCLINEEYVANLWGTAAVGITECTVSDLLGFFTFEIYKERGLGDYLFKVSVCPDIPEITDETGLVRYVCATAYADDSEETKESHSFSGGTAGYEHRDYYPGDPIKRINWKLSVKRDKLMVRLDDEVISSKQVIILDCVSFSRKGMSPEQSAAVDMVCQTAAEAMLGIVLELVKTGVGCLVSVLYGRERRLSEIASLEELERFRTELSYAEMGEPSPDLAEKRIPEDTAAMAGKDAPVILFTACPDRSLAELAAARASVCGGIICCSADISPAGFTEYGGFSDLRIVDSEYVIRKGD